MSARGVLRIVEGGGLSFWCPGCESIHTIYHGEGPGPRWTFDSNYEKPTFGPSVLVQAGHYASGWQGPNCLCTYAAEHPEENLRWQCVRCHSFVRNGNIEFLSDSTHELAGQT